MSPASENPQRPSRERALERAAFPWSRVAGVLGLDPDEAELALRDEDRTREAVLAASRAHLAADDDRRAGRVPDTAIAAHPDFPTGMGMSLIGAGVLWEVTDLVPQIALRVAKDHHEDGDEELAASFAAMVAEFARPPEDDAVAWAAQSLLVDVFTRAGSPDRADALARDLAAHAVPGHGVVREGGVVVPPQVQGHGGAFVEGMPPRRDGRALTFEEAAEYVDSLLTDSLREREAEGDGAGDGPGERPA